MSEKPKIKIKLKTLPHGSKTNDNQCQRHQQAKIKKTTPPGQPVYHTIKCPLKAVLKHFNTLQPIIEKNVTEINQIIRLAYQFIRLYVLEQLDELHEINKQWILDVLKTICTKQTHVGRKPKQDRQIQLAKLQRFYEKHASILIKGDRPSYTNKTHIFDTIAREMLTCITTNLSTHFIQHLSRYLNLAFKVPQAKVIHLIKEQSQRKEHYKALNKEIRDLKTDLIQDHKTSASTKYHPWINEHRDLLFPKEIVENVAYDVKCRPLTYLKHAIYINQQIELLKGRPYQVLPQRNNLIPHYITLDTTDMVDIIDNVNNVFSYPKTKMYDHIQIYQKHIWKSLLKLEKMSIFHHRKYSFHYQIKTDGWSCCLLFILNEYRGKKMTDRIPEVVFKEDEEFKKLSDLTSDECYTYSQSDRFKLVGLDPGKRKILTINDGENHIMRYSACQRRQESYTKRSAQILEREKMHHGITERESILTGTNPQHTKKPKKKLKRKKRFHKEQLEPVKQIEPKPPQSPQPSGRTLDANLYRQFVDLKNIVSQSTEPFYERDLFRKLAFRRYVRVKQSEHHLIHQIREPYLTDKDVKSGKQLLIFYGDYSRTSQMKGCVPSPNIGIKRLLAKHFLIVEVDEYLTSQKYWRTGEQLKNLQIHRGNHRRSIHEILTLQEETERCIRLNRDVNASHNLLNLGQYYLSYQDRPDVFKRGTNSV